MIPKKSWLKGYGRNAKTKTIDPITLHALAPEVAAWTPENDEIMYVGSFRTPNRVTMACVKLMDSFAGVGEAMDAKWETGERVFLEIESNFAGIGFRRFITTWRLEENAPLIVQYRE